MRRAQAKPITDGAELTVRDLFAAAALAGMVAGALTSKPDNTVAPAGYAVVAWNLADAMMATRGRSRRATR